MSRLTVTDIAKIQNDLLVFGSITSDKPVTVAQELTVTGQIRSNNNISAKGKVVAPAVRTEDLIVSGSGTIGQLTVNGSATLGQLTVPSSRNWKYDISGLSGSAALALLDGLNPVAFKFKGDDAAETHLGFIAEDIPTVLAGPQGQSYRPFEVIAVLTKALQEQQGMIQALQ